MRNTKASTTIAKIFANHPKPLSAIELQKQLETQKIIVNKTTIYRQLQNLIDHKTIRKVDFGDGVARFEAANETHHHHLICDHCGEVKEISFDESAILKSVAQKSNFTIKDHSFEFFGLCKECFK